jgi:hypothetical protein
VRLLSVSDLTARSRYEVEAGRSVSSIVRSRHFPINVPAHLQAPIREVIEIDILAAKSAERAQIGIEHFGAHDLCRNCAKLCRKN